MNTLALPDFSKASIVARTAKTRDPLAPPQAPAGILKKDWLLKHRTRVPAAVAAMFRADQVSGDPAQWLQACSDLENLKCLLCIFHIVDPKLECTVLGSVIQGRRTKLMVILVQSQACVALRKHAEVDPKHLVVLVERGAAEWTKSLNKLKSVFTELCSIYYKDEGRRIKAHIDKRNFSSVELGIHYGFKVEVF
ncbi:hypothetical protein GUJ93_ZPchr0006g42132 [Zizania palustris]|uniref:Uncharacterized protein n=1 Tax=Zizania palustris TaxID=103762 RepID=A0A8J5VI87_ZIZPA|nr:hypothetical protein GUJ93_ZPchr0006g42132 [Zizania palustris]